MNIPPEKRKEKYTYADYLNWPDGERWEIINGIPFMMSPAPSRQHQQISGSLFAKIYNYLENKTCQVYSAPFDVRFAPENKKDDEIETVVQPDILVVCDDKKLDEAVEVYTLNLEQKYEKTGTYFPDQTVKSNIFEDLAIDLNLVF
jgi:Uma2 family endonuclease